MINPSSRDINTAAENHPQSQPIPLKRAWIVGANMVIVIDKSIVRRLGITEENTLFQQEIVDGGILLKIVPKDPSF